MAVFPARIHPTGTLGSWKYRGMASLVIPISLAILTIGLITVILVNLPKRERVSPEEKASDASATKKPKKRGKRFEFTCNLCTEKLEIPFEELNAISAPEMALIVSQEPAIVGRPVSEYRCEHCGADHYFATDRTPPEWIIVNAFEPEQRTNLCAQCRRILEKPTWPKGKYDGRIHDTHELQSGHGLVCHRCKAVCCVECCQSTTRNRTEDGSYLCPRCDRGPVETIYHY